MKQSGVPNIVYNNLLLHNEKRNVPHCGEQHPTLPVTSASKRTTY